VACGISHECSTKSGFTPAANCIRIIIRISVIHKQPTVLCVIFCASIMRTCGSGCTKADPMKNFWNGVTRRADGLTRAIFLFGITSLQRLAGAIGQRLRCSEEKESWGSLIAMTSKQWATCSITRKGGGSSKRLASTALPHWKPGASPQDLEPNRQRALKARINRMNRAFSAGFSYDTDTLGRCPRLE
jgi:hypothetical protein